MAFYEMSIENGSEYIRTGINKVETLKPGMSLIGFLDVNWHDLKKKSNLLLSYNEANRSLCYEFYDFYKSLDDIFKSSTPLLKEFFNEQLMGDIKAITFKDLAMRDKELEFINCLYENKEPPCIEDEFPRMWIKKFLERFKIFADFKDFIVPMIDEVMTENEDLPVAANYYKVRMAKPDYSIHAFKLYQMLSPNFYITRNDHLCEFSIKSKDVDISKKDKFSGHTFQSSDSLEAIMLWEFDTLCSQNISIRRCELCNRFFIPFSVVSCYCDRPVEGKDGRTCKDIGANLKHQREVNSNAAKKLYQKVNNRIYNYCARQKKNRPYLFTEIYPLWQKDAKAYLEKVDTGEITYEEFKEKIDKKSEEALREYMK